MYNIVHICTIYIYYLYTTLYKSVYFFTPVKSKKASPHRGEVLQTVVSDSGMSITLLVKRAGYSRSSYYNHILDPQLDLGILEQYGKVLKHDFSINFPEISNQVLHEDPEEYNKPATIEQAVKQAERWKEKYYAVLEKYHQLLEERIKK